MDQSEITLPRKKEYRPSLTERLDGFSDYYDPDFAVRYWGRQRRNAFTASLMVNPSPSELISGIRSSGLRELRGLIVEDRLYWWDANIATHAEGRMYLKVEQDRRVKRSECGVADIELHMDSGRVYAVAADDEALEIVLNHPTLKDAWTPDWYLKGPKLVAVSGKGQA